MAITAEQIEEQYKVYEEQRNKRERHEILYCDIMIFFCFCMYLFVHFMTNYVTTDQAVYSQAQVEQITTILETNPIASMLFNLGKIQTLIFYVLLPGMFMATYLYIRKRVKKGLVNIETLSYFCALALFSLIVNVVNDLGIWLRVIL